jgi:hypothetical protein
MYKRCNAPSPVFFFSSSSSSNNFDDPDVHVHSPIAQGAQESPFTPHTSRSSLPSTFHIPFQIMDTFGHPQVCSPTFQSDTSPDPSVQYDLTHFGETFPHNTMTPVLTGQFSFLSTSFVPTPSSPLDQLLFPFLTSPQHVPFQASPPPQPYRELAMTHDPLQPTASWNAEVLWRISMSRLSHIEPWSISNPFRFKL